MSLTDQRLTANKGALPVRGTYPIAANVRIFKGAQIGIDAAGRARPAGLIAAGSLFCVGKASAEYDNTAGAAGAFEVEVEHGTFAWNNHSDGVLTSDIGKVAYAVNDVAVSTSSDGGTRPVAGFIDEVRNGKVWVWQSPSVASAAQGAALALAGVSLQKRTLTVGHADLTAAATTQTINLGAALPANARILGASIAVATAFAGITGPISVDLGSSGDVDSIVDGAVVSTAVNGQASTLPSGIAPSQHFVSPTQLLATVLSASGNLDGANAGAMTIDVLFAVLA